MLRDTKQVWVRLYGIDFPEKGQAYGKKAKQFTSRLVCGKVVEVEVMATDRYGRTVAMIFVDKTLLNEELVKVGLLGCTESIVTAPSVSRGKTTS